MKPRHLLAGLIAGLLVIGLSFGLTAQAQMQPKRGGTLTYMVPASGAPSLDAHRETTFAMIHPTAPFYSLLVRVDPRSEGGREIACDLCTDYEVSNNGRTYTFNLHRGVKFHDGTDLTAEDVIATYNKIIFPPDGVLSARKAYFTMVDSIEAPDEHTVVFNLKFPSGAFLPAMAMPFNYIYSKDKLDQDMSWYEQNVMGSGPFRFVEYSPGSQMVGERFDNYFKEDLPYLDGFEAVFAPQQNVQVQAIRAGRAHSMFRGLPPATVEDLTSALGDDVNVQSSTWNCGLFATFNPHVEPLDDVRVRRALNLAVDRWAGSRYLSRIAIVKTVGGLVFPGHDLAPSQSQLETLEGFGRDIEAAREQARQLLEEAGATDLQLDLNNRNTDQPYRFVGTWLIDQWRQIGVNVEQQVRPTAAFYDVLRGGNHEDPPERHMSMDFNCQSVVNPNLDVSKWISDDRSGSNHANYIDREMDRLFDEQLREGDPQRQKELLWQFQQRFIDQAYAAQTQWWQRTVVHRSSMKWWEVTPSHYLNMQLEPVWLDE